mgnify:CR=1 FL=1
MANRHHRRALRFFWAWLLGATLVSLAGNVAHALLTAPTGSRWLAAAVAAVPPTVLLAAVHGVAVLVKANASGAVYRTAVAATAALAAGAFVLSFVALRDLAVLAGISPALAAILPLVIDLAVAVATIALVAIGDKPARRRRTATSNASPTATTSAASPGRTATTTPDRCAPPIASDATARLAAELVATKTTRQPVETVEAILTAHRNGDPLNRIAATLGVHHSAVKRVLDAAENLNQRRSVTAA